MTKTEELVCCYYRRRQIPMGNKQYFDNSKKLLAQL